MIRTAAALFALVFIACAAPPPEPPFERPENARPALAPGWERPVLEPQEPPPTGHAGMYAVVATRVGPLYVDMPAELDFLREVFTDFDVRVAVERIEREQRREIIEIREAGERLLVVEPAEPTRGEPAAIARVRVESSLFLAPGELGPGDSFEDIARAFGPLRCRAERSPAAAGPDGRVAACRSRAEGAPIEWIFPAPDGAWPADLWSPEVSAERLADASARELWWRPGARDGGQ